VTLAFATLMLAAGPAKIVVPPPPSPFEADIAAAVVNSIVQGKEGERSSPLAESIHVSRTVKYPGASDFEVEYRGQGRQAFVEQARFLVEALGRPDAASCDAESSICKFSFTEGGRFLLAGMTTRNHKVESVQFIYLTREMAARRMGKASQ
jgi:hypothetical protein